jgi:peptidyl-Lys metalloendopeptidase
MLERTRDMRARIARVRFEQDDEDYYAETSPWGNTIELEGKFWTAPRTGHNSRAGTVIHEASHFWGSGGTGDPRVGKEPSRRLAEDLPPLAMANADNTEYYFEHLPK